MPEKREVFIILVTSTIRKTITAIVHITINTGFGTPTDFKPILMLPYSYNAY